MKKVTLIAAIILMGSLTEAKTLVCSIEQDGFLEDYETATLNLDNMNFEASRMGKSGVETISINSDTDMTSFVEDAGLMNSARVAKRESCVITRTEDVANGKIDVISKCRDSYLNPVDSSIKVDLKNGTVEYEENWRYKKFGQFGMASLNNCVPKP